LIQSYVHWFKVRLVDLKFRLIDCKNRLIDSKLRSLV